MVLGFSSGVSVSPECIFKAGVNICRKHLGVNTHLSLYNTNNTKVRYHMLPKEDRRPGDCSSCSKYCVFSPRSVNEVSLWFAGCSSRSEIVTLIHFRLGATVELASVSRASLSLFSPFSVQFCLFQEAYNLTMSTASCLVQWSVSHNGDTLTKHRGTMRKQKLHYLHISIE